MKRLLLLLLICASPAGAAIHYVSTSIAGAADTNAGTKAAPWLHAPGMNGCASNCASYTPAAGDSIIFYGGDTWTNGNFQWAITWAGTSGNPIYFGVDQTWFNSSVCGASWCQPIFDFQNTLVSGCTGGTNCAGIWIKSGANYVTLDNIKLLHFELPNNLVNTLYRADLIHGPDTGSSQTSTGVLLENLTFKDWGMSGTISSGSDTGAAGNVGGFIGTSGAASAITVQNSTADDTGGACGSPTTNCFTGSGFQAGTYKYNVCSNTNNCFDGGGLFISNIVHDMKNSTDGGNHENAFHAQDYSTEVDNVIYNVCNGCSTFLNEPRSSTASGNYFSANNLVIVTSGDSTECFVDRPNDVATGGTINVTHYNDTCVPNSAVGVVTGNAVRIQVDSNRCVTSETIINMHSIPASGYSGGALVSTTGTSTSIQPFAWYDGGCTIGVNETVTTSVPMNAATATSQGYTLSNWYQPTLNTNSTVGVGTNETSVCTGNLVGLCNALNPTSPATLGTARPTGTTPWDAGAYEFSSTPTVATPTLTPSSGTVPLSVTISTSTTGATICWAVAPTTPAGNGSGGCAVGTSLVNGGTISVTVAETVNAIGTLSGDTDSAVASGTYHVPGLVPIIPPKPVIMASLRVADGTR